MSEGKRYLRVRRELEPVTLDPGGLMSMGNAASLLDVTVQDIMEMALRGRLVVYSEVLGVNPWEGQLLLLRADVLLESDLRDGKYKVNLQDSEIEV